MGQVLFAIREGWRNRWKLAAIPPFLKQTHEFDLSIAAGLGVRVLALDFDGVLGTHDAPEPLPAIMPWLDEAVRVYGAGNVFILSNKPTEGRRRFFETHYPGIRFVRAPRKKPYPDGLHEIIGTSGVAPHEVLFFDDRLLTGVLASVLAGTRVVWVAKPYIDMSLHPLHELFFRTLRAVERRFLRWC